MLEQKPNNLILLGTYGRTVPKNEAEEEEDGCSWYSQLLFQETGYFQVGSEVVPTTCKKM